MQYNNISIKYNNEFCYHILIENDFNGLISYFEDNFKDKYANVCIVTDSNVAKLYLKNVCDSLKNINLNVISYVFEAGESSKNSHTVEKLYEVLINNKFDRNDLLVALGGGVVGDLCGFAASTYLRGIDFIQIPTTLLSQVDSSIGGKTGIDFMQYKNMIGAFYMPKFVYINISTLNTLDDVQFACGMGEVIKHGLIKDFNYFKWLEDNVANIKAKEEAILAKMVYQSCIIKGNVVEIDPKETGIRAYLNFGHTIGHAIEKLSDFKLFHGQCVALGMICALKISEKKGLLSNTQVNEAINLIKSFELPFNLSKREFRFNSQEIVNASKNDKKMENGKIKFILLKDIGNAMISTEISDNDLIESIETIFI